MKSKHKKRRPEGRLRFIRLMICIGVHLESSAINNCDSIIKFLIVNSKIIRFIMKKFMSGCMYILLCWSVAMIPKFALIAMDEAHFFNNITINIVL